VAGLLGIGGLPIAALLISTSLGHAERWYSAKKALLMTAHLTWISVVLLIGSLVVMTMQFAKVYGGQLPQQAPLELPAGVLGLDGWADRFLILAFCAWVITVAWHAIRVRAQNQSEKM
jgi:TRAP-type mannitol/chloroaromatic compound transport system permease large subunit